jgi:DNA-binding PadR family transcriptional regulator
MVYPALTYLEEIGYATVETEKNRKLYQISAEGKQYLKVHQHIADAMFTMMAQIGKKMAEAHQVMAEDDVLNAFFQESGLARQDLRRAVSESLHKNPQDIQRIVGILRNAAEEIRQISTSEKALSDNHTKMNEFIELKE